MSREARATAGMDATLVHWILPGAPIDSMREAVLTVLPKTARAPTRRVSASNHPPPTTHMARRRQPVRETACARPNGRERPRLVFDFTEEQG
eukprot:79344-Rhodomonas_salina.2